MGGGDNQPTQNTTQNLSPQQQELLQLALPGIRQFAASVPKRYGGSTVAGFDPYQLAAQDSVVAASGKQQQLADAGSGAFNDVVNYKPQLQTFDNKPRLDEAITAATRPIGQQLTETALPAIRGEAVQTGYGGSRQGIAEGLASGRASQAEGDTASKLSFQAYDTDTRNQLQNYIANLTAGQAAVQSKLAALGLLPTVQQAQTTPGSTLGAVGDVRQQQAQTELGADIAGFNYDQLAPFLQSKEIASLLQGLPGGSVTSTANNPNSAITGTKVLGGAATGAALGAAVLPGVGAVPGAIGGALTPFVFG